MTEDIKLAVKKGAYWLDQVYPEWVGVISLDRLDLQLGGSCVLGQIGGDYWEFFRLFKSITEFNSDVTAWMEDHGFEALDDYDELTDAWVELIEERRADVR
jgi:hypothetical protein